MSCLYGPAPGQQNHMYSKISCQRDDLLAQVSTWRFWRSASELHWLLSSVHRALYSIVPDSSLSSIPLSPCSKFSRSHPWPISRSSLKRATDVVIGHLQAWLVHPVMVASWSSFLPNNSRTVDTNGNHHLKQLNKSSFPRDHSHNLHKYLWSHTYKHPCTCSITELMNLSPFVFYCPLHL